MLRLFLIAVCCFCSGISSPLSSKNQLIEERHFVEESKANLLHPRDRRQAFNVIEDCITVTSKDGHFHYKADSKDLPSGGTCGLYLITDPERLVEIELTHVDVSCDEGGLVSVVDGWELNGEFFPSPQDHHLPIDERIVSDCGNRPTKTRFLSSQNAALVQYRVPKQGQGFSLKIHYVKNPYPCNILVEGTSDVYKLSNHGRNINCSVTTLFPARVSVTSLDVGATSSRHLSLHSTSGAVHKCEALGMSDFLQIGGSSGLDTSSLIVADSICGVAKDLKGIGETIACGITTVRLVSSGRYRNSVTVAISPADEEDLFSASFMCSI